MKLALVGALGVAAATIPFAHSSASPGACAATVPTAKTIASFGPRGFNYGTTRVRVQLWQGGHLRAGTLPDGGAMATINADGSIDAKQGWWRGVPGTLRITGRRIDGSAPPLKASVPGGYGRTGFNPAGLTFPTVGCWKVTGKVGTAQLSYVVRVTKIGG
jgi:hypothetical protein